MPRAPRGGQQQQKRKKHLTRKQRNERAKKSDPREKLRSHLKDIVVQLSDSAPQTRYLALNSLAHVLADPENHALAVEEHVVPQLLFNLDALDDKGIQCEVIGCFRNFANNSDPSLISEVFTADVRERLALLLETSVGALDSFLENADAVEEAERAAFFGVITQSIKVLSLLSENLPSIVDAITLNEGMLHQILSCIRPSQLPPPLVATAAECLLILSEDNAAFAEFLAANPPFAHGFLAALQHDDPSSAFVLEQKASLAGVLLNSSAYASEENLLSVLTCLRDVIMAHDVFDVVATVLPKLSAAQKAETEGRECAELNSLNEAKSLARAVRISFELLSNLLSTDSNEDVLNFSASALQELGLFEAAVVHSRMLPTDTRKKLEQHDVWGKSILAQIDRISQVALGFITNYASFASFSAGGSGVSEVCLPLFEMLQRAPAAEDESEDVMNCLWAVLRENISSPDVKDNFAVPEEHLNTIPTLAVSSESESLRVASLGVLGCFGQMKSMQPYYVDIAKVLVHAATDDASFWARAEAINAIFDTLAEEESNDVCEAVGLREALQAMKKTFKPSRDMEPDLQERVDETLLNLKNFIAYKSAQWK